MSLCMLILAVKNVESLIISRVVSRNAGDVHTKSLISPSENEKISQFSVNKGGKPDHLIGGRLLAVECYTQSLYFQVVFNSLLITNRGF